MCAEPEVRQPQRTAAQGGGAGADGDDAGLGRRDAGATVAAAAGGATGGVSAAGEGAAPGPGRARQVAVIGAGKARPGSEAWELAEAVGRRLAEAGVVLVCGGGGGVMEAACRGAA